LRITEEVVQVPVGEGLAAERRGFQDAPPVAADDEEGRRLRHPGHAGDEAGDDAAAFRVRHLHDIGLLQVGLGRRRKRDGRQQP
jgi:hypothetical protein